MAFSSASSVIRGIARGAFASLCAWLCLAGQPMPARAAPAATAESRAEALFREGKALSRAGMTAEACAKFEESEHLEASAGTLLNLGDCYERAGQLLRARDAFERAAPMSLARGKTDWAETARARAVALSPKVPLLQIALEGGQTATVDARRVDASQLANGLSLEVGDHTISVTAGTQVWTKAVHAGPGARISLVPVFGAQIIKVEPSADPPPDSNSGAHPLQTVGAVMIGVGGAALVTGLVFGGLAIGKKSNAVALCPNYVNEERPTCSSAAAENFNDSAKQFALGATVLTASGAGAALSGLLLYLIAPKAAAHVSASVSPHAVTLLWTAQTF